MEQEKKDPVKTMLTLTVAFIALYLVKKWNWALIAALLTGSTGMFSDFLSRKVETAWMKLSQVLGLIMPAVLLGAIFYLLIFPLSFFFRLLAKKDPLLLKNRPGSIYQDTKKEFGRPDFERTW